MVRCAPSQPVQCSISTFTVVGSVMSCMRPTHTRQEGMVSDKTAVDDTNEDLYQTNGAVDEPNGAVDETIGELNETCGELEETDRAELDETDGAELDETDGAVADTIGGRGGTYR